MDATDYRRFPKEEYVDRCNRARKLMGEKGVDALLISEGSNYTYFSGGTRDFSHTRPTIMVLPLKGDPTVIVQWFPRECQRRETWVSDVRVYDTLLGLPHKLLIEVLSEKKLLNAKIGAELGYEQRLGFSYLDFMKLKEMAPKAEFADAADIFWGVRMIKSRAEIQRHTRACVITGLAYDKTFAQANEGMTERQIQKILFKEMMEAGGDSPWCLINSGPENYAIISGGPTELPLRPGNILWIDGGCLHRGYGCDYCRNGVVGAASDKQKKMYDIVCAVTNKCVEAVKPGVKASDLCRLNNAEFEKYGINYDEYNFGGGRIGHGVGSMLTEPPHIAMYDDTVLKPGMIITIEPGLITDYGCFQLEQDILVTEDGYEVLSTASEELRIIK